MRSARLLAALVALAAADCQAADRPAPVVVELFTSQGCSSCPRADELLSRWGEAAFKRGAVIPLSYNVDYWDYLGWKDIFSTPAYSARHRRYSSALRAGLYTPQFVVAGRESFSGTDPARLAELTRKLSPTAAGPGIRIAVIPSARARLRVEVDPGQAPRGRPRVMLALFENGLVTRVLAGENAGGTLRNDFVVRRLEDLGPWTGAEFRRHVDEPWDPAWRKENSGAAVFLQDADTLVISGAAAHYPLSGAQEKDDD